MLLLDKLPYNAAATSGSAKARKCSCEQLILLFVTARLKTGMGYKLPNSAKKVLSSKTFLTAPKAYNLRSRARGGASTIACRIRLSFVELCGREDFFMVEERLEVVVRSVRLSETMRCYSGRANWVYSSMGYQYFAGIMPEFGKCRRSQICFL